MKKKIIDLEILENFLDSGVSRISLVDSPAIEVDWFAFNDEKMSFDPSALTPYVDEITEDKEKMEVAEIDVLGYKTRYFYICPGALGTFTHIQEMELDEETKGMVRSAAVIADRIFQIEAEVIEKKSATEEELREAVLLIDDFKDIFEEIDQKVGMEHDVSYMDRHAEIIYEYYKQEFDLDEACWPGYEAIGTKIKDGRRVPNCVPVDAKKMLFANEDEKILIGPVAIPGIEIIRKDENGDPYYVRFTKEVVAKMSEKFMKELRNDQTNIEHEEKKAGTYIMESWLVEDPEHDKINIKYGFNLPEGTWVAKMRVTDEKVWKAVKEGKLNGFSIEGNFMSKEDYKDFMEDRKTYEKISKILRSI